MVTKLMQTLRRSGVAGGQVALLAIAVAFLTIAARAGAQQETPTVTKPKEQAAGPADDFGRGTSRSMMQNFLKAAREGDYRRAAEYLDLSRLKAKERMTTGPVAARHLKVVLDRTLWVDFEALSDAPEGDRDDGLPARWDRIGTISTSKEPVDVIIERVQRDDGVPIWKISSMTLAKLPGLYAEFGYGPLGDLLPEPLFEITFLGVELWQWIGLVLLTATATLLSWWLSALIVRIVRPLATRFREGGENTLDQRMVGPLRVAIGIGVFYMGSLILALSLAVRLFFNDIVRALVIVSLTWLALRFIDLFASRIEDRFTVRGQLTAVAMLPLGRRTAKVFLVAMALLALLENVGFNVTGVLAGLGLGGLAVALAAQETVKNFFGGVALITDQPVRVGDFCRFGDKMGTIEDISIWSTRVRTPDRTLVSIPNGQFAGMPLENFTRRDRTWLHTTIGLQYGTEPEQLRRVLVELQNVLIQHPKLDQDTARARFAGFGGPALQIEISAYVRTARLSEFLAIREEIFLQIMDIVSASGTKLVPT